jgi:predicted ATPase
VNDGSKDCGSSDDDTAVAKTLRAKVTIKTLTFSDGTTLDLNPDDIVVLVGPNNSGKSASLREIEDHLRNNTPPTHVVTSVEIDKFGDAKNVTELIEEHSHKTYPNGSLHYSGSSYNIQASQIDKGWTRNLDIVRSFFCRRLKTESRITDSNPASAFKVLSEAASRPIQMMYADSDVEDRLSGYFKGAFGLELIVLKAGGSEIPLLVGESVPLEEGEDRTTKAYLERLMKKASPLMEQGDGMRSFASVILEMLANRAPSMLLLDEPEAFLHPPQARLLGEFLAKERREDAQMFIATHSPDVLVGLLNVAPEQLRVIRIQRDGSVNHVKELEKAKAKEISSDPLMKYSSVLSGIFHKRVVICEADSDCLFYQAILAHPTVNDGPQPDVLFLHASGKHRMAAMAEALRALGVPVDVIADIDLLREEAPFRGLVEVMGRKWEEVSGEWARVKKAIESRKPWLNAQAVQTEISKSFSSIDPNGELPEQAISSIKATLKKASPWEAVKAAGVAAIPSGGCTQDMQVIRERIQPHGIWIVPVGELEGFCRSIGGHGPKWVQKVLEEKDLGHSEFEEARRFMRAIWQRGT